MQSKITQTFFMVYSVFIAFLKKKKTLHTYYTLHLKILQAKNNTFRISRFPILMGNVFQGERVHKIS